MADLLVSELIYNILWFDVLYNIYECSQKLGVCYKLVYIQS